VRASGFSQATARSGAPAFVTRWISRMMSSLVSFGVSSQSASTSPDIAIASMLSNARACPRPRLRAFSAMRVRRSTERL